MTLFSNTISRSRREISHRRIRVFPYEYTYTCTLIKFRSVFKRARKALSDAYFNDSIQSRFCVSSSVNPFSKNQSFNFNILTPLSKPANWRANPTIRHPTWYPLLHWKDWMVDQNMSHALMFSLCMLLTHNDANRRTILEYLRSLISGLENECSPLPPIRIVTCSIHFLVP